MELINFNLGIGEKSSGKELNFDTFRFTKDKSKPWNKEGFWNYFDRIMVDRCGKEIYIKEFNTAVSEIVHIRLSLSKLFEYLSYGFFIIHILFMLSSIHTIIPIVLAAVLLLSKFLCFNLAAGEYISTLDSNFMTYVYESNNPSSMNLSIWHYIKTRIQLAFTFRFNMNQNNTLEKAFTTNK